MMKPKFSIFKSFYLLIFIFFILQFSFFNLNCNNKPTPPDDGNNYVPSISLTAEDVGVTDACLRVRFVDTTVNRKFKLVRDGQTVLTALCSSLDTIILDENLLPNHTYNYKALRLVDTMVADSVILTVQTMDTTSHEYFFQIDTLGDGNSSVLRDVFILNDTLAYAVGEIYKRDSLGQFNIDPYNFLKWNGKEWEMNSITYVPLRAVFAFSEKDIWAGSSAPYHWDGTRWRVYNVTGIFNGYINKFWGTSSSNLYMVGTNGSIAHYNGTSWRRLESGTDVNLTDVWGSPDGSVVWACGWEDFKPTILSRIKNGILEKVYEDYNNRFKVRYDSLSGGLGSCWTNNNKYIYVLSSSGLYQAKNNTKGEARRYSFTNSYFPGFPWRVRGNAINDIFISGEYFMLAHFNGVSFKYFNQFYGDGRFKSLDQKGNQIVAVGYTFDPIHSRGIVIRGRR